MILNAGEASKWNQKNKDCRFFHGKAFSLEEKDSRAKQKHYNASSCSFQTSCIPGISCLVEGRKTGVNPERTQAGSPAGNAWAAF